MTSDEGRGLGLQIALSPDRDFAYKFVRREVARYRFVFINKQLLPLAIYASG